MKLYRLKINPVSAWRTPWQADTIAGLLCWAFARKYGGDQLRREVLAPCETRQPLFVLSDAFPHDYLPVPEILRLHKWPDDERKKIKQARWLVQASFRAAQAGARLSVADFLPDSFFLPGGQPHNMLDRMTDTTSATAGSLYTLDEVSLDRREINRRLRNVNDARAETSQPVGEADQWLYEPQYLSVYARIADGFESRFLDMFHSLAETGFGADVSTGKGQFEIASDLEDASWLDTVEAETTGLISLSTFQPDAKDPTGGYWQAFTKFGKVGPDFGLANVFKRPMLMLRPGACFKTEQNSPFLGRAIPMQQVVSEPNARLLGQQGALIAQLAYGLCVPSVFQKEEI